MTTNAPRNFEPGSYRPTESPSPAPPAKQLGTVRIEVADLPEVKEALSRADSRIRTLEKENETLKEALAHWQGVVRVAREKDSTLPDPEAVPC